MRFKSELIQEVKLVMYEKTMLPESNMQEVNGKKQFVKTGKETEMTTYTFRDGFGEKLVVLSKDNSYRALEGEIVELTIDCVYNDFTKKNRVSLVEVKKHVSK